MSINEIKEKIDFKTINKGQLSPYFNELIGIKYITIGQKNKAYSIFNDLNSLESTPFDLKIRLKKLIQIAG